MKELKANRVPPGDRWALVDDGEQIYSSLTEALNKIYMDTGLTQFYIDAQNGDLDIISCAYNEDTVNYFENELITFSLQASAQNLLAYTD